ncbi:Hint domain-containing protein [Roseobacter weihaiensis]|uniref:Hint domain-containing protein n=1 Tax=Roseobacter weihaiensis TaxID=2763262 RepID=UPI001D0AB81A|nr:Hint domain-containing protein [Roseobacter sp. H9]
MANVTLFLRGDQLGRYTSFSGQGNGPDRVVTVNGVEALGQPNEQFTVLLEQVNNNATEFRNGQFISISDSNGNVVVPRTGVQPDIEQGLGGGDEHLILPGRRFLIDLGGVPAGPQTVTYTQADEVGDATGDDDGNLDFNNFPCFAPGTLIDTPIGPKDVAQLAIGDPIAAQDHGSVPVRWIGQRTIDLDGAPGTARPVLLKAGCFGQGAPSRDTIVSPDHRILIRHSAVEFLFGLREALAPAKALSGLARIRQMAGRKRIQYFTLLTDRHEVIFANGLRVETLYPGPEALKRLGAIGRSAVTSLLPDLLSHDVSVVYPPARPMLSVTQARALAAAMRLKASVGSPLAPKRPVPSALRVVRH